VDDQGHVVSTVPNENYQQPTPTQLTADTTAPYVPLLKPDGTVGWVANQDRVTASDAVAQLAQSLGVQVTAGQISEKSAQDLITDAVNAMNARSALTNAQANMLQGGVQAGQAITSAAQQGAQTGAGLLQNRVTAATGALQNLVGQAANAPHLMSVPAELGQQLVGGLQGWATELGGGQGVYDAAANLVKSADPTNSSGMASQGYAALQQMLQKYQDLTGQQHPAVDVVRQQAGLPTGFNAPTTAAQTGFNAPQTLTPQQLANQQAASQQTAAATQQFGAPFGALGANRMPSTPMPQTAMPFGAVGNNPMLNAMQNQAFTAPQTFQTPVSPAPPKVTVSVG
jgi:hypothetical protein